LHFAEIVIVIFQRFLSDDDIPAAGHRRHHEIDWARFRQLELHGVFIARVDRGSRSAL
jgi:hypothetical protein